VQVVDLDVEAEEQLQFRREDLHLLCFGEHSCSREEGLETVLVLYDVARALTCH
jgi:hypothetical protein